MTKQQISTPPKVTSRHSIVLHHKHNTGLHFTSTHVTLPYPAAKMAENIYDEIEIEDMTYDPVLEIYHYPCPCGDRFEIAIADLRDSEDIAVCPSCSLMIRVIFEVVSTLYAYANHAQMSEIRC